MLTGFVAAMLVIAGLVPTAYNTTAGFTLEHLHGEQNQLRQQLAKLDAAEAKLASLDRLQHLAKSLNMTQPVPQQVETLDGSRQAALDHPALAYAAAPGPVNGPPNGQVAR